MQSNPLESLFRHTPGFCFRKPNYSKAWRSKETIFPETHVHGKNFVIFVQGILKNLSGITISHSAKEIIYVPISLHHYYNNIDILTFYYKIK